MRPLFSLRHMIGLFGLLMLLCMGLSAHTAPVCSQLLLKEDFYVASLDDLASMKLEVDLAMMEGSRSSSVMNKINEDHYSQKYTELMHGLSKRLSKGQINEMLRTRISELQAENKNKDVRQKEKRNSERRALPRGQFNFTDRIELPYEFAATDNAVEVVPGTDSVLISNGLGETLLFNHKNKKSVSLKKGMGIVQLIPGTQEIAIIKDSIQIYDVQVEGVVREIPFVGPRPSLPMNHNTRGMDPSGRYLAFSQNGLKLIDLRTGEFLVFPNEKKTLGDTIKELLFITDHELIVRGLDIDYRSQDIAILDVRTGVAKSIPGTSGAGNFTLVAQGQKVLIALKKIQNGSEKFALYDTKDFFADPVVMNHSLFRGTKLAQFMAVPQSDLVSLERLLGRWREEAGFEIYHINDLNQVIFKFDIYESSSDVTAQGFAPEAAAAVFLFREPDSKKRCLDIWSAR